MGHFKVASKVKLADLPVDTIINESDYSTLTPDGTFVQLKYIEDQEVSTDYTVRPGIFVISVTMDETRLVTTKFVSDKILEEFLHTKDLTERIDLFFSKLNVYKELGVEVPKRAALLFGPAGSGKSTSLTKVAQKYNDDKTLIIVWPTDRVDPGTVKSFVKSFKYEGVERMILIAEDIGGVEMDQVRMKSPSSLLSLLDNQEMTFKLPIFIIATTNHPEVFLGNLTNRPNRFDDKIEMGFPPKEFRIKLLEFFNKSPLTNEQIEAISSSKTTEFTPAHIREIILRSRIYDKSIEQVISDMIKEIETYNKGFNKDKSITFDSSYRD